MQRLGYLIFILMLINFEYAGGTDTLLQTANQIVRLSEEMVSHGAEGHLHEIVDYGEKAINEIDRLTHDLRGVKRSHKKELQKGIRAMRDKTEQAIRLGKQGNLSASVGFAKSALYHAKKVRQGLHSH